MSRRARYYAVVGLLVGLGVIAGTPSRTCATLPANEIWREDLLDHRVGYGRNATGGAGGTLCTVSNLNDAGAGSLRSCVETAGPQWIIFSVSGTITLSTPLHAYRPDRNDKTIDGRGQNIVIDGGTTVHTLLLTDVENWIVHDVSFTTQSTLFFIRFLAADTIWLDHLTLYGYNGGQVLIGMGSNGGGPADNTVPVTDVTISYVHFHSHPSSAGMVLIGQTAAETIMANSSITLHHNWYQETNVRHPFIRYARVHSFNNYFDDDDIGVEVRTSARFVSEHDIFECDPGVAYCGTSGIILRVKCAQSGSEWTAVGDSNGSTCKVTNPWLVFAVETYEELNAGSSFNPASDYTYTLETADAALRSAIMSTSSGAGAVPNPYGSVGIPGNPTNLQIDAGTVLFPSDPTSVNVTAGAVDLGLANPTLITIGAAATPTFPGAATSVALTADATPPFPGEPTGVSVE